MVLALSYISFEPTVNIAGSSYSDGEEVRKRQNVELDETRDITNIPENNIGYVACRPTFNNGYVICAPKMAIYRL